MARKYSRNAIGQFASSGGGSIKTSKQLKSASKNARVANDLKSANRKTTTAQEKMAQSLVRGDSKTTIQKKRGEVRRANKKAGKALDKAALNQVKNYKAVPTTAPKSRATQRAVKTYNTGSAKNALAAQSVIKNPRKKITGAAKTR